VHEILIFLMFYVISLGVYKLHEYRKAHAAKREIAERAADALNAISPLHELGGHHKRHIIATIIATVAHPATAESLHHYVVHFLIYSGNVIK
jgi:hypothetical protein